MKPDRVVAWVKGAIRGLNLYTPQQIVERCNTVNSVCAEFLDHSSPERPFFTGWVTLLNKHFRNMPGGFTSFYFFEMDKGVVTYRHTATDTATATHNLLRGDCDAIRRAILQELVGVKSVDALTATSINTLRLPRHKGNVLKKKKVMSISNKYFSIPTQYLSYYPKVSDCQDDAADSGPQRRTTVPQLLGLRRQKEEANRGCQRCQEAGPPQDEYGYITTWRSIYSKLL